MAPPATSTSFSPAAARACSIADSMPSVTKLKVVPPSIGKGSRAWWVSTNTGAWNGGSSPHQPRALGSCSHGPLPPLYIRRPITTAPVALTRSAMTSESALRSPPSCPWVSRQLCGAERPLVQPLAAAAERILEVRVRPGDVAVERHRDVGNHLAHGVLLVVVIGA